MAVLRFGFMEKQEEDVIHEQSIECLEKMGVLIHSDKVLKMLRDGERKWTPRRASPRFPRRWSKMR